MSARIEWRGADEVRRNMAVYGGKVHDAVRAVANYWAGVLEAYAKDEASWTDRTGNARQGLHTFIEELAQDTVALYLSHGVEYGKYLELRWQGRFAIIMPTLESHYAQISAMLQGIFGN